MINLTFRDLRHDLYILKVYDKQFKFNNYNKLLGFVKCLTYVGLIQDKDFHIYKLICRKEKV